MEEVSMDEKLKIASSYLINAPPGEFSDVFNDVRVLINDDGALQSGVSETFQQYNTDQFTPVDVPGQNYKVIVSKFGQVDVSHYLDPRSNQVFQFDHMRLTASNPQPSGNPADAQRSMERGDPAFAGGADRFRNALDDAFQAYIAEHYPNGVATVYGSNGSYDVAIVDNKYSPRNYWNGRWRSNYHISGGNVKGTLRVQVHYYEDGNVQLQSEKEVEFAGSAANPADIVKQIKKAEAEYQQAVNESYAQLSDTTFKALRRALPITRNKLDWNKIMTYKLGGELSHK